MKVKFKCTVAIAALLAGAPMISAAAPDAKKADPPAKEAKAEKSEKAEKPAKAKEVPLPEKPDEAAVAKALKAKKPMYTRFADAKEAAGGQRREVEEA